MGKGTWRFFCHLLKSIAISQSSNIWNDTLKGKQTRFFTNFRLKIRLVRQETILILGGRASCVTSGVESIWFVQI